MLNNIKSYLYIFAKNLGHNLTENDYLLNEIAKQIESRILSKEVFSQANHSACKKCKMIYEERGSVTNKKYKYCIFSESDSKHVPINCPKVGETKIIFDKTEEDAVADIRKRGKL